MAVKNRVTTKEQAEKVFKPSPKETNKAKLSTFFPKDSIFTKTKSYQMKGRDGVHSLDAEWRNIAMNGVKIVLIKDNAVSKADLKQFSKEAKAYYLKDRISAEKQAEEERIATEEKERERIRKENEQLKKEAEERDRVAKIESEKKAKEESEQKKRAEREEKAKKSAKAPSKPKEPNEKPADLGKKVE